jgi:hypothetical protein
METWNAGRYTCQYMVHDPGELCDSIDYLFSVVERRNMFAAFLYKTGQVITVLLWLSAT